MFRRGHSPVHVRSKAKDATKGTSCASDGVCLQGCSFALRARENHSAYMPASFIGKRRIWPQLSVIDIYLIVQSDRGKCVGAESRWFIGAQAGSLAHTVARGSAASE